MTVLSLAAQLAAAPAIQRDAVLQSLTTDQLQALQEDWRFWARPSQLPPTGDWTVWLRLAGRGEGKTWTGANWSHEQARDFPGSRGHLVAPTAADLRDTMIEGPAGILVTAPRGFRPFYEPSKRKLTWPNGSTALLFSADEPERFRGPQCWWAWCDEAASWRYPEAFDQLLFGLRLGSRPRVVVTTTPKPVKLIRDLIARTDCVVSRGKTADNRANLAAAFLSTVVARYEGTRLGRQELDAELLEDVPGALWTRHVIEESRVEVKRLPALKRMVVGIDPAATSSEGADETGIVLAALGIDGHGYVLTDASARLAPAGWATKAITLYRDQKADRIVAEINNGGEMVEYTLRTVDPAVSYRAVHATRGKAKRAEPVSALYEQGKVHHVGSFPQLEDQMCNYVPDQANQSSPDRMDALVWALTDLMIGHQMPAASHRLPIA